jgi:transposase
MALAYSNDLRRKLLEAHEQGQGTLPELAGRFRVSLGYAKKISAALRRTGRMERSEQRHGRISRVTPMVQQRLRAWLREQPDRTLVELQGQMREQCGVQLGLTRLWVVLEQMKLRLKKSRSTPPSRTRRKTGGAARRGGRR